MRRSFLAVLLLFAFHPAYGGPAAPVRPVVSPIGAGSSVGGVALPTLGRLSQALSLPSPLSLLTPLALPRVAAGTSRPALPAADERSALAAEVWRALAALPRAAELRAFARANGLRIVVAPFAGQIHLGLDEDNLAQLEFEDRIIYLNWDMAAPDIGTFMGHGLPVESAREAVALLLAPVAAHELLHAKLRLWHGSDFPGTREEEILTHIEQAEVFDETIRLHPSLAAADCFLVRHNKKVWQPWREGFGPVARYVLRKYDAFPSLNEPQENAQKARRLLAGLPADSRAPPAWRGRLERAIALWDDPEATRRLVSFFQVRIDVAVVGMAR